ncbi:taste receptor type 1 member 1 [Echeneis naucrates]|uniref:G-protein coupled receptors family 3 profile domain-containing protein n=1 Tax=Echeneis naucrates TaxID=173247 RepID=A0A665UIM8_ECHNA|nr:taste receptor type 1 member 2 [Echeneis naucrates]
MFSIVFLCFGWLMAQLTDGKLDYISQGQGMQLQGNFSIAGLFPLHYTNVQSADLPTLVPCNISTPNKHGFHLLQAMRFAVEEINNGSGTQPLLPGVKLGYQMYDICSVPASILATLDIIAQQSPSSSTPETELDTDNYSQRAVAVIGPDSSSKSFTPARLLGAYLVPQISYEATTELLSNKLLYPAFLRTIPSDKNQVAAIIQLLNHFNWTWIALLGSDNTYGLQGMQGLSTLAAQHGICIAYQGVIPSATPDTAQTMRSMVDSLLRTQATTIIVFSSRSKLSRFFPFVIERNVTGKVWIGSEDWSQTSVISGIPGIHTIGTVLGVSIKHAAISGFEDFERKVFLASVQESDAQKVCNGATSPSNDCLQSANLYSLAKNNFSLGKYDITSSFNVYKAVHAVAHALHKALDCDSGQCQGRRVYPWELLSQLKQVQFSLDNDSVYFDANGDPLTGYDIVTWIWRGTDWSVRVVGSFSTDPIALTVYDDQIEWHGMEKSIQVPLSICSPPCPAGHKKLLMGQHSCCFDCQACPGSTFLNISEPTMCQPCLPEQWAPPSSERCLNRTVLLLAWDAPISITLFFFLGVCLLMTCSSAVILLFNLNTPVAKSAGGRTCLLMLAGLSAAAMSSLCHFGQPSPLACILKQPLFIVSFTVCLASITMRSLQVVCIFKFASKLPPAYDKWAKKYGPEFTIILVSATMLFISVLRVVLDPPQPSQDLDFYKDRIVLECSNTFSPGAWLELTYVSILSALCFSFSYMGKDLPANYNEAKCITFSLMVYIISWMSFFTLYLISRDQFTMAAHVFAILFSVLVLFGGYFLPKIYIIVLKPQMNTTAHFQNCIQMYTMSK